MKNKNERFTEFLKMLENNEVTTKRLYSRLTRLFIFGIIGIILFKNLTFEWYDYIFFTIFVLIFFLYFVIDSITLWIINYSE